MTRALQSCIRGEVWTFKVAELAVRNVIRNEPVMNREALANPEALQLFEDLPELQS